MKKMQACMNGSLIRLNGKKILYLIAGIVFFISCESTEESPNIVLVLADDMGYSDLGCYGSSINTPNIDRLAFQGVRFTRFYNSARCCPSRASLLTGLYPHQTGLGHMTGTVKNLPGYKGEIGLNCITIAEALKSAGYSSYMAGKWHVAMSEDGSNKNNWPCQRGFDHFFGTIRGGGNFFEPNKLLLDNDFITTEEDFYYTHGITEHCCQFIKEHKNQNPEKPFFLYAAYTAPHFPLHAPDSAIQKYLGKFDKGWDVLRKERYNRMRKLGILHPSSKLSPRNPGVPSWDSVEHKEWQLRRMEVYAAMIDQLDQGIGKMVKTLKENDEFDNTLFMFLSDNGGCAEEISKGWLNFLIRLSGDSLTSDGKTITFCNVPEVMPGPETSFQSCGRGWANLQNTPFRMFKHYTHEGGISTPFIMHWPAKIKNKGSIIKTPANIIDLMPTCLAVAGGTYPEVYRGNKILPFQGESLIPMLNTDYTPERALYFEHEQNKAMIDGDLKLVKKRANENWELYKITQDRVEQNDISAQFPQKKKKMIAQWNEWAWNAYVLPNKK